MDFATGFGNSAATHHGDGNFIAFLTTLDTDLHVLQNHTFYCSGPNRAHLAQLPIHRSILLCDWPAGEAEKETLRQPPMF